MCVFPLLHYIETLDRVEVAMFLLLNYLGDSFIAAWLMKLSHEGDVTIVFHSIMWVFVPNIANKGLLRVVPALEIPPCQLKQVL